MYKLTEFQKVTPSGPRRCAALSFWLLSVTLKTLPIGFVYAVWTGIGVAAIAVIGVFWFNEPLNWGGIAGIGLIVTGVAVLQLSGSGAH